MSKVELLVGGVYYGGWQTIDIQRGIEQIAGTFELQVTEYWPGSGTPQQISPGAACQVLIDGETVITGYVDTAVPSYDDSQHSVTVSGRDKTADLVDCAAIYKSGAWSNRKLEQIAADLCQPFGIEVKAEIDTGAAFIAYSIQEGETVFECLERATRMRAVLLVSDGLGRLVITRAGSDKAAASLEQGKNILLARGEFSWKDRFSQITVKGQAQGNDDVYGETVAHPSATATDATINRYRPLIVLAEDQGHAATLKQRAAWEANVRRGRGNRATVTINGWKHASGLWRPNTLVNIDSGFLAINAELLIAGVRYTLNAQGERTELSLAMREAFDLIVGVKGTRLESAIKGRDGAAQAVTGEKKKKKSQDWTGL